MSELSVIMYYFFLKISTLVVFEMKVKISTLVVFEKKWCPMLFVWFVLASFDWLLLLSLIGIYSD